MMIQQQSAGLEEILKRLMVVWRANWTSLLVHEEDNGDYWAALVCPRGEPVQTFNRVGTEYVVMNHEGMVLLKGTDADQVLDEMQRDSTL